MDEAKTEVLAFTAFPRNHWPKVWSTQPAGTGQQGDPSDGLDAPGGHDGGRLGSVTVAGLTQKRSFDGRGPDRDLSFV
jgi:hypothetical protein